jgi:probable F420-dependent oxidoreductase
MAVPAGRPLTVGLLLPTNEGMVDGAMPRWPELLAIARHAEAVGFDALWVADHLGVLDDPLRPGDGPMGTWECWSVLAALAAATTRIRLGSLVSCTAFRNPALLAKMAVTVDEVSGGRLTLGLGAGSQPEEFAAFGYPTDDAIGRFEEAVTIIGGLLRDGQIDFVGRHSQARECELRPRGPRPAGPPILIAARSPRVDRLAARHADGWNAAWPNRAQALAPRIADIDAACRKVGRDPASLERSVGVMVDLPARGPSRTDRRLELAIELLERIGGGEPLDRASLQPLAGSAAEIAAELRACADLGITSAQIWLDPLDLAGVEAFAPVLELLGPAVADAR